MKQVVPALFEAPDKPGTWAYLLHIAQQLEMSPFEMWSRYFSLTKTEDHMEIGYDSWGAATFFDIKEDGRLYDDPGKYALGSKEAFLKALHKGNIYVPGGWSRKVITDHKFNARTYEHPEYPPGTIVKVDIRILESHSEIPIAGLELLAWYGVHTDLLSEHQRSMVPVILQGMVWYVEPEYITLALK